MKKKILIIVIAFSIFVTFNNLHSQSGWFQQISNTSTHISSVFLVDQLTGYFIAGNNLFSTTNGGTNWELTYIFTNLASTSQLYFINSSTGYLISWGVLYKTTNQGIAWSQITIPSGNYFSKVKFLNSNTGFIVGSKFAKTINGGSNWVVYDNPHLNGSFGDFYFINQNTGFSLFGYPIGYYGVAKTTTGGESWTENYLDTIPLNSLSKPFGRYMYASGNNKIVRSTDYGNNWNIIHQSNYFLSKIEMVDSLTGYCIGSLYSGSWGIILKTINGGINWNIQYTQSINTFTSISFVNPLCGNAVGSEGLILRTNTGGIVTHINNQETITKFNLSQNYPNPFNPSTTIKFEVPKSSFVKITVFDISGKEIETLINEKLQAGTYQTEWNGSNYSSGVYFYKMITPDYSETKKMTLIK